MGIGGVVVQFKANADQAIRETKKLARHLDGVDREAKNAGRGLSGMAKVGLGAVAAGAATAGYALFGMVEGAVADDAAQRRLAKALQLTSGATDAQVSSVEAWITAQGRALGVTDDELRPALARLARSTKDVGKAQEAAALAMDISAATGTKQLATVADAVAKAMDGNTGALGRMGIKLGEGQAGWDALKDSVKGSAEAQSESVEGAMTKIKTAIGEAGESVGTALLPKLQEFSDWLASPAGIAAMEDFATSAEGAAAAVGEVAGALKDVADWYDSWPEFLKINAGKGPNWNQPPGSTGKKVGTGRAAISEKPYAPANVQVTVNNGKQEKAIDSAAMGIRLARLTGGF